MKAGIKEHNEDLCINICVVLQLVMNTCGLEDISKPKRT